MLSPVAAVSVGIIGGEPMLDLNYVEDVAASVDMNIVMNGAGEFIEVQGTGEEATFTRGELDMLLRVRKNWRARFARCAKPRAGGRSSELIASRHVMKGIAGKVERAVQLSVRINGEAEDAVVELFSRLFGVPASVYSDTEKKTTTVTVHRESFSPAERAAIRDGLRAVGAAGLRRWDGENIGHRRSSRELGRILETAFSSAGNQFAPVGFAELEQAQSEARTGIGDP